MKGSIKKNPKTGKWDFRFNAGKHPLTGKRRQIQRRGFTTKQLALKNMLKLQLDYQNDEFLELSTLTYGTYMDEWFQERKHRLEPATFKIHSIYLKNIIKPRLGHMRIQEITPMHIQHFINELANRDGYARATIHLIYRIVDNSMKKAKIFKLIKSNPTEGVTIPKIQKKEIHVWSLKQVNEFIEFAEELKNLTRCYTGFLISLLTGMRQGEVLGLRWQDIHFDTNLLYITQTVTQDGDIKHGAKNDASVRVIHFPERLKEQLLSHFALIKEEQKAAGTRYEDHDLVMCTKLGKPLIPRNFRKEFYNLTEKSGLPKIRFHDLRHTHATILIQQNVNVKLISERLGHKDIDTTLNIYSHVIPSMQESVSAALDEIITTKK